MYWLLVNNGICLCFGYLRATGSNTITLPITYTAYVTPFQSTAYYGWFPEATGDQCVAALSPSSIYMHTGSTTVGYSYWFTIGY